MLGKNHMISNVASTVALCSITKIALSNPEAPFYSFAEKVKNYFVPLQETKITVLVPFIIISFIALWFGTYMPDMDSSTSKFGKVLHIPAKHRTWLHAIWFPIIFFIAGFFFNPFAWLALGYTLHLFWDSLSRGGVCWFYPFSEYKNYPNGAMVKKGHKIKLYRVGEISEKITVGISIVIAIVITFIAFFG